MHWKSSLASAIALMGMASITNAANTYVYNDAQSGFTFTSFDAAYEIGQTISYRLAIPDSAAAGSPYDVVIQVVAPIPVGWAGLAFGGSMVRNPLAVGWASGSTVVVSSRFATSHTTPTSYPNAQYQLLTKATQVNGTHWKYTAKCTGCTTWTGSSGTTTLNPSQDHRFAFAYSNTKPSGTSPSTPIQVHSVTNYWTHDFNGARNANFEQLVQDNL